MPGQHSSHGASVTFDGTPIGWLTDFDWEAAVSQLVERTNVTSRVVGTGANARVVKEYDCTSIEPPSLSFAFWGAPGVATDYVGRKATLAFDTPGATISGEAILKSISHSGKVRQFSRGTATFQLTGASS
jgi:hypothetical protein